MDRFGRYTSDQSLTLSGLTPGKILVVGDDLKLKTSDVDVNAVNNLVVTSSGNVNNPYYGTFEATDLKTSNVDSVNGLQGDLDDKVSKSDVNQQTISSDLNFNGLLTVNKNDGVDSNLIIGDDVNDAAFLTIIRHGMGAAALRFCSGGNAVGDIQWYAGMENTNSNNFVITSAGVKQLILLNRTTNLITLNDEVLISPTFNISCNTAPTTGDHLCNKDYVDSKKPLFSVVEELVSVDQIHFLFQDDYIILAVEHIQGLNDQLLVRVKDQLGYTNFQLDMLSNSILSTCTVSDPQSYVFFADGGASRDAQYNITTPQNIKAYMKCADAGNTFNKYQFDISIGVNKVITTTMIY